MRWSLRKWYVDCVAADGAAWIGYWGRLRWGPLRVSFVSSLVHEGDETTTATRVRAGAEPHHDADALRWSAPSLGVELELAPRVSGIEKELHEGVTWRCVAPCGDAVVRLPGRTIRGRGYAEVLEMSVPPWRLPIRTLRWGRVLGARTSLVWIQWSGANPLQVVARDGAFVEAASIDDDTVRLADGTHVTMSERSAIREAPLAETLRPLRAVTPLLPRSLTGSVEQKWRSRGTIAAPERPTDEGWAIHELLTFAAD